MAQEAKIRVSADARKAIAELRRLEKQAGGSARNIAQDFQQLTKVTKIAGGALTAMGAAGALLLSKSTLLAARVETLGIVLLQVGKTAGYTETQMRAFEKAVKDQGITTQAARVSLVRLVQAEVDLAQASDLARIAQDAAVIAGINSSQAFERMIWGINTLNPRVLKTMGLTISLEQAYSRFAKAQGITINELTQQQKKQIAVNEVITVGERITGTYSAAMETAGKKMTSLARHVEEASLALGTAFLPQFASLIDMATDALKAFNELEPGVQRFIAFMLAGGTAVAAIAGPILLLLPQIAGIGVTLVGAGQAMLMTGAASTIMGKGLWVAAAGAGGLGASLTALAAITGVGLILVALAVGAGLLAKAVADAAAEERELNKKLEQTEGLARKATNSYKEYLATMQKVADATDRVLVIDGKMVDAQGRVIDSLHGVTAAQVEGGRVVDRTSRMYGSYVGNLKNVEKQVDAVNEAVWRGMQLEEGEIKIIMARKDAWDGFLRSQESGLILQNMQDERTKALEASLSDLAFVMQQDFGAAAAEYEDTMNGLVMTSMDLEGGIFVLEERLRKFGWLNKSNRDKLAGMRKELEDTRAAIDLEREAWERNTAQMIFNMTQRALADAPLQDQVAILSEMAVKFGLIDEVGALAWRDIADAVAETEDYDAMALKLDDILLKYTNWPTTLSTDINMNFHIRGGGAAQQAASALGLTALAQGIAGTGSATVAAAGGLFGAGGGPVIVGEEGEEMIIPVGDGFMVLPAELTKRLQKQGVMPKAKMAGGGSFAFDAATLVQITGSQQALTTWQASQLTQQTISQAQAGAGGGGGGAPIVQAVAAVAQATQETVAEAVQDAAAAAVAAASAPIAAQVAASTQQARTQTVEIVNSNRKMLAKLEELIGAVRQGSTDTGVGRAFKEAAQFLEQE